MFDTQQELKATILGAVPSKSNCYQIITLPNKKTGGTYSSLGKTKSLKVYEDAFYMQLPGTLRNANITGRFEFVMDVYYPSDRSDLDNSLKVVLDCLQKARAIDNDRKCVKIVTQKFIDKVNPRVEFQIKEV